MKVRNDPVTVIVKLGADATGEDDSWEGALGVDAKVRRPACFLSERVLAEDEIILT